MVSNFIVLLKTFKKQAFGIQKVLTKAPVLLNLFNLDHLQYNPI